MKRYVYLLITVILICSNSEKIHGLEEFYSNQNGLSLMYLQGFNPTANAVGLSYYFKKGLTLGLEKVNEVKLPSLSILYCPGWGVDSTYVKSGFGATYGYYEGFHIVAFHIGLIRSFSVESKFPFSLNVSISPQVIFTANQSSPACTGGYNDRYNSGFAPIIGCGFTQAFFEQYRVYPYIGISLAYAHCRISVSTRQQPV